MSIPAEYWYVRAPMAIPTVLIYLNEIWNSRDNPESWVPPDYFTRVSMHRGAYSHLTDAEYRTRGLVDMQSAEDYFDAMQALFAENLM